MKTNKIIFCAIIPIVLAIPCLYYGYLMLFNPVISGLTSESLALRLAEGQKSFNYTIWSLGKPAIALFVIYIVVLLAVLIFAKTRKTRVAK